MNLHGYTREALLLLNILPPFFDDLMSYNILFVISSSAVSWMNKNVFKTAGGLHGKTDLTISLKPFTLKETVEFLLDKNPHFENGQLLEYYFYTGGVVRYLRKIGPSLMILENVKRIFQNANSPTNEEFDVLFSSIFEATSTIHKDVILTFKNGNNKTKMDIFNELKKVKKYSYNTVSSAVDDLIVSDILSEIPHYKKDNDKHYFLTDLFCYFYVKLIKGKVMNFSLLEKNNVKGAFEVMIMNNIDLIKEEISRNGFKTDVYSWKNKYAQIDVVMDYGNHVYSLVEAKYHNKLILNREETDKILTKKDEFLNSLRVIKKEMDVILITFLGVEDREKRFPFIEVVIDDVINRMK